VKRFLRNVALVVLRRAFYATQDEGLKQAIFRRIRRADHATDEGSRALMKEYLDVEIGRMTYGAYRVDGTIAPGTRIGSFCSIAEGARLGGSNHPQGYVSTHPFQYLSNRGFVPEDNGSLMREMNAPVVIEDDVWVCANAVVVAGVTVGRGSIVGAGAVVTRDVPPYSITLGVPAKVIGTRLPEDQIEPLLGIDWPSWDDETLRERLGSFYQPEEFIRRYGHQTNP
jgi:acetyltransferase-like isoleucine patch superfamily enzyme